MCICVLAKQTTERVGLHHHDQPRLSSRFSLPVLTAGPMGTLATAGTECSRSDFWFIAVVVDGTGVTGSFVDGVAEEEAVWDRFFLMSASRFLV